MLSEVFFFFNYVLQERSILISTYARKKKKRFFPEKAFFSICFDNICFWIESTVSVHSFDVTTFPFIPKTDSFEAPINLLDN